MLVSLIVAISLNKVIGKDNTLIWHLPADLAYFKQKTLNHHIILGRKNYLSIPEKYRPLPNRTNIVLSRTADFNAPNCIVLHSIEEALQYAKSADETEVFIIGGGQIYKEALEKDLVDKMYISHIQQVFVGDTFFPEINLDTWSLVEKTSRAADEKNAFAIDFCVYKKRKN